MKKILICLLMLAVMLTGMMNVYAAESEMEIRIQASSTQVQVGDTVEYTVQVTGQGVTALQFQVRLPEGLRYVPNSGATPEGLAQKLGIPAADWTEQSMMFTCFNDVSIPFDDGMEILRFSCVAEKEGSWDVELFELIPFDTKFQEFTAELQVRTVRVTGGTGDTKPTDSTVSGETVPAVTAPSDPEAPSATGQAPDSDPSATQPEDETAPDPNHSPEDRTENDGESPAADDEKTVPETTKQKRSSLFLLLPLGGVLVITCGVAVFLIIKKKK